MDVVEKMTRWGWVKGWCGEVGLRADGVDLDDGLVVAMGRRWANARHDGGGRGGGGQISNIVT